MHRNAMHALRSSKSEAGPPHPRNPILHHKGSKNTEIKPKSDLLAFCYIQLSLCSL
jgi:hypothetical protein